MLRLIAFEGNPQRTRPRKPATRARPAPRKPVRDALTAPEARYVRALATALAACRTHNVNPGGKRKTMATKAKKKHVTGYQALVKRVIKSGGTMKQAAAEWRAQKAHGNPLRAMSSAHARASAKRRYAAAAHPAHHRPTHKKHARGFLVNPPSLAAVRGKAGALLVPVKPETMKLAGGALAGIGVTAGLPMLLGSWNQGWTGLGATAAVGALATLGASMLAPAFTVPVGAGAFIVALVRAGAQVMPSIVGYIAKPLAAWAGVSTPPASGAQAGYAERALQRQQQAAPARIPGQRPGLGGYSARGHQPAGRLSGMPQVTAGKKVFYRWSA